MKQLLLIISFLLFFITACQQSTSNKDGAKGKAADITTTISGNKDAIVPSSISAVFSPNSGVFRGLDFSMNESTISRTEKAMLLESSKNNILKYSVDMDADNFADIQYECKASQLTKIQVDIFTKDQATAQRLYADLASFFDQKYKKRKSLWEGSENNTTYTIYAKPILNSNSSGIYIVWEKL